MRSEVCRCAAAADALQHTRTAATHMGKVEIRCWPKGATRLREMYASKCYTGYRGNVDRIQQIGHNQADPGGRGVSTSPESFVSESRAVAMNYPYSTPWDRGEGAFVFAVTACSSSMLLPYW